MTITSRQADLIVNFVNTLRPDWDIAGIRTACRNAAAISSDPSRLMCAAIFAANTPRNVTPAVIGMRGPHWESLDPNRANEPRRNPGRCEQCHGFHALDADHDPPPADPSSHVAAAKAAIRPVWKPAPTQEPQV
jgi:hypothetical protein